MSKIISKRNLISVIVIVVLVCSFVFVVHGGTINNDLNNSNDKEIENVSNQDNNEYKLLYQNVKESNDRILAIVQWAFGIVITSLIALIGGSFYQNYRHNQSKIKEIEQELEAKVNEFKNNAFSNIDKKIDSSFKISEQNIKELFKTFSDGQSKEIENFTDKINTKLDNIKEEFSSENKKLKVKINENINKTKSIENKISTDIDKLEKNIMININKIEGDLWLLKKVENNALRRYVMTALLELEVDKNIEHSLEKIINVLKDMDYLSGSSLSSLQELLKAIPDIEYGVLKDKLTKLIDELPIR